MQSGLKPLHYSLEARFYADPDVYFEERKRIFRRSWQLVGAASAVAEPGGYLATTLAGYQLFAQRGADGVLRAFENMCPHRGAQLLPVGSGSCDQLRCPYHGWLFAADGRLEDTPWFDEPSPFDLQTLGLSQISVAEWRGLLFVAFEPQHTLVDQLGDIPAEAAAAPMEEFALHATRSFTEDVNWKVYLDQFNEFYHTPAVHGSDKSVGIERYEAYPLRGMMLMTAPRGEASDAAYYGGRWMWGWPNWTVSFFPGGMKTSRIDPLAATRCRVDFAYYFADMSAANSPFRDQIAGATESIFGEDIDAAKRAQANYSSGAYRPGPLHPRLERAVAYFQARVRRALDDGAPDPEMLLGQPGEARS